MATTNLHPNSTTLTDVTVGEGHLIQHHQDWINDWSSEAQELHGLKRGDLVTCGKPCGWIVDRMGYSPTPGATLYSNQPPWGGLGVCTSSCRPKVTPAVFGWTTSSSSTARPADLCCN
jgi:hypothetical protein